MVPLCFKISPLAAIFKRNVTSSAPWGQPLTMEPLSPRRSVSWLVVCCLWPRHSSLSHILGTKLLLSPKAPVPFRDPHSHLLALSEKHCLWPYPPNSGVSSESRPHRLGDCPLSPRLMQGLCCEATQRHLHFQTLQEVATGAPGKRLIVHHKQLQVSHTGISSPG